MASYLTYSPQEFKQRCASIELLGEQHGKCTAFKSLFDHTNKQWNISSIMRGGRNLVCNKDCDCNFVAYYTATGEGLDVQVQASNYGIGPKISEVWTCVGSEKAVVISELLSVVSNFTTYFKDNLQNSNVMGLLLVSVFFMLKTLHQIGYVLGQVDLTKIIGNADQAYVRHFRVFITDFTHARQVSGSAQDLRGSASEAALKLNDYNLFVEAVRKLPGFDASIGVMLDHAYTAYSKQIPRVSQGAGQVVAPRVSQVSDVPVSSVPQVSDVPVESQETTRYDSDSDDEVGALEAEAMLEGIEALKNGSIAVVNGVKWVWNSASDIFYNNKSETKSPEDIIKEVKYANTQADNNQEPGAALIVPKDSGGYVSSIWSGGKWVAGQISDSISRILNPYDILETPTPGGEASAPPGVVEPVIQKFQPSESSLAVMAAIQKDKEQSVSKADVIQNDKEQSVSNTDVIPKDYARAAALLVGLKGEGKSVTDVLKLVDKESAPVLHGGKISYQMNGKNIPVSIEDFAKFVNDKNTSAFLINCIDYMIYVYSRLNSSERVGQVFKWLGENKNDDKHVINSIKDIYTTQLNFDPSCEYNGICTDQQTCMLGNSEVKGFKGTRGKCVDLSLAKTKLNQMKQYNRPDSKVSNVEEYFLNSNYTLGDGPYKKNKYAPTVATGAQKTTATKMLNYFDTAPQEIVK